MTDMLDLITLFAGIGIGWLMGRTLAKPQRAQNAAGRPYTAPQGDLGASDGAVVTSDDSDPAERRTASDCPLARARGTSAPCAHLWQNVGNSSTRYCARCGTEWTEAGT